MTDLLDRAVTTLKTLPPERRDEIARLVIALAGDDAGLVELTPEEDAALARSEAAAARGEFASDNEVAAIWAKRKSTANTPGGHAEDRRLAVPRDARKPKF